MSKLSEIYVIREVAEGSAAMWILDLLHAIGGRQTYDWDAVSRVAPDAGPAWDMDGMGEWAGESPVFLIVGNVVLAFGDDDDGLAAFQSGHWVPLLAQRQRAWVSLENTAASARRKAYFPIIRNRISVIDMVGVDPSEVSGAHPPVRPIGRVSAQVTNPSVDQVGQVIEALTR